MDISSRLNRKELGWVMGYALVLILVTSLPYFIGYAVQGDNWRFTGFVIGVEDGNSYIAKMRLGAEGAWLFRTPYTTMPQKGVLAFLPYLLLGKLAQGDEIHTQMTALYHLSRMLAIPLAVWATYLFASVFLEQPWWRKWTTILITAGGGLGWAALLARGDTVSGSIPLDFISPETFGFLSFLGLPHLVLSRALLLLALICYLDGVHRARSSWMAGFCLAGLALIQPLSVLAALAVIAAHQAGILALNWTQHERAASKPWIESAIRTLLIPLPVVVYLTYAFSSDPYLVVWTSQNRILSPHPIHYLIAYGILLIPVFIGAWKLLNKKSATMLLPVVWAVLIPVLAYFPHNLQRRLPEGSWTALAILAAAGLVTAIRDQRRSRILGVVMLALSLISSIILVAGGINTALTPSMPAFRAADEVAAIEWLSGQAGEDAVVLATYRSSNPLPAWAGVRVIVGHGPESAFLEERIQDVDRFFSSDGMIEGKRDILERYDVDYVFIGPQDGLDWEAGEADFLEKIYEHESYSIYRVKKAE